MTIRLLAAYSTYPINAIVSLDVLTETNLLLAKVASSDLTGGVSYVTAPVAVRHPPAMVESDSSGAVTGLVGADGSITNIGQIRALSSTCMLGDSLSAYGVQANPANITGGTSGGIFSNSFVGWYNELAAAAGGVGFDVIATYAVGGKTLTEILNEQVPLAVLDAAECAVLHGGVNTLNLTYENKSVDDTLAIYRQIITKMAAAKKLFIVDSINPVLQTGATNARQRAFQFPLVNAGIAKICSEFSNVLYNDMHSYMVDPASTLLNPLTGLIRTDDGIHNQSAGGRMGGGVAMYKNIAHRIRLTKYKAPGANLLPAFAGTGGTITPGTGTIPSGTPPVGWNVAVASGTAAVTITSLAPDMVVLGITNSGASASTIYVQVPASFHAQLAAGDVVQGGFSYQCWGNVGLNRIALTTRYNGGTSVFAMGQDSVNEPTINYPQNAGGGRRETPPFTLPATPTQAEFIIGINVAANTGATNVALSTPKFNKLN